MQTQKKAHHSAVSAAARSAGKTRSACKSRAATKRAKRPVLQKAKDAIADIGGKAVETVKSLAHKGEDLVSKVFAPKNTQESCRGARLLAVGPSNWDAFSIRSIPRYHIQPMLYQLSKRMLATTDKRLLWKFAYNFGYKGMRSVQKFKARIKRGEYFPPFLYISIINSCNLRCQGCWVKVDGPQQTIDAGEMDRIIDDAKRTGTLLRHPRRRAVHAPGAARDPRRAPDCYFQIFTNGQFITDEIAQASCGELGNATPLVSIEGTRNRLRRAARPA